MTSELAAIAAHLAKHGTTRRVHGIRRFSIDVPVPEELRPALFTLRDRWLSARRKGGPRSPAVKLSPMMLALLRLETPKAGRKMYGYERAQ